MLSAVLVASIAVAVILGYKTKINTGFFCIAFAYLIGCFGMGLKTKELIGFWPVSTMFVILSVSLFYNFAAVNGTLEKMSASLLYMCRKFPGMLPFALFFVFHDSSAAQFLRRLFRGSRFTVSGRDLPVFPEGSVFVWNGFSDNR